MFNNLLNTALSVIPKQAVSWRKFDGNTTNDFGLSVPSYADAVTIYGSIQSVTAEQMQRLGLDASKVTMKLYTTEKVQGISAGQQSDLIDYAGHTYTVITPEDWQAQDGWQCVYLVRQ